MNQNLAAAIRNTPDASIKLTLKTLWEWGVFLPILANLMDSALKAGLSPTDDEVDLIQTFGKQAIDDLKKGKPTIISSDVRPDDADVIAATDSPGGIRFSTEDGHAAVPFGPDIIRSAEAFIKRPTYGSLDSHGQEYVRLLNHANNVRNLLKNASNGF